AGLRHSFLARWAGRVLLAALALYGAHRAGAPLPCGLEWAATIVLFVYCAWGLVRVGRWLVRRLLWRIRTKLLVSYLFIAVVPVVLLMVLFVLAGVLFSGLVASHIVASDLDRTAQELRATAQGALSELPPPPAAPPAPG